MVAFDNYTQQKKLSPSLRNILKEVDDDTSYSWDGEGSALQHWAEQGVLLLNTALTVEASKPGSHTELWKEFTNTIITDLNKLDNIVWILWGAHAKSFKDLITNKTHHIIEGGHPSPLNTKIPFRGGKYFSEANVFLEATNQTPISW